MIYLDTSLLVPLLMPERASDAVRKWFYDRVEAPLAISDWTFTEFASAMGIKVRRKDVNPHEARGALLLMRRLAAESLTVLAPSRRDYEKATEFLDNHQLGLRGGDALHLAIAHNEGVDDFYTLDRRLIDAGRRLKVRTRSPI